MKSSDIRMGVDNGKADGIQGGKKLKSSTAGRSRNTVFWRGMFFLAFTICFVAGGFVPKEDIIFAIFTTMYIEFMNTKIFPAVTSSIIPGFSGRIFAYYMLCTFVGGLILPLVYVSGAYIQGDIIAFKEAVPSLFLVLVQVHSENYTYSRPRYSHMIRVLLPVMYNTRRIFTIWSWTLFLFGEDVNPAFSTGIWLRFGQILAVVQVIIWNFNLFCFLLPVFLPRSIRQYNEIEQKLRT